MLSQDLVPLLRTFAVRVGSATVDYRQFLASPQAAHLKAAEVAEALAALAAKGACAVVGEGEKVRSITLPDFHTVALVDHFRLVTMEAWRPFPREESPPAPIPVGEIVPVDVKGSFISLLDSPPGTKGIVKLQFPEGIDSFIVPREIVGTDLIEAAVAKISYYLHSGKNASYAETKLCSQMKGNDALVRQSIEDVNLRPKKATSMVLSPNDFHFKFWTNLANLVLQDLRAKKDKTVEDHGVLQSAFIVGYAVFHSKGVAQREQEREADRKSLHSLVRKAPYVFGFEELFSLKDARGVPFVNKYSRSFITSFLEEKTKRTEQENLPYLVRVHAKSLKKDYFIQRDLLVPVFLKKLSETAEELRVQYLNEWVAELRRDSIPAISKTDAAFRRDVEIKVKESYPLLEALDNGSVLFLAGDEAVVAPEARAELAKCFAVENILKPLDQLLGLSRAKLLKDARSYLPFWQTMPIISQIVRFFRRILQGRASRGDGDRERGEAAGQPAVARLAGAESAETGAAEPKSAQEKENLLRYRRTVQALVSQYVPAGKTIDGTLAELAERWNPLYDPQKKRDLVDDVNSLVRDFLRPVRRTFLVRPPDLKRIHDLAERLCESKSLVKIKKRDVLMRYLELYMVRCLQAKKL